MNEVISDSLVTTGYDAKAYNQRVKGRSSNLTYDAIWKLVEPTLSGVVLDVGCGEGNWLQKLRKNPRLERILGVDLLDYGAGSLSDIEFNLADLSKDQLPCPGNDLDWIFAIEVLEHLANPRNLMKEASRCLKQDGKLVITTPCNESLRAKAYFVLKNHFPDFCYNEYHLNGHITPIMELDLRRMASEVGFTKVNFFYPVSGRIPKTTRRWNSVLPFLRGKTYADTMFAVLTK